MYDKDRLKEEIDQMPDELVEKVYTFITLIKKNKKRRKTLHTFRLNGAFDHANIRKKAYE